MIMTMPIWLGYIIYKIVKNRIFKFIVAFIFGIVACWNIYAIYIEFYPTNDFYLEEFKKATLIEAPTSAKVLNKATSYPDFHGDYCSASEIVLAEKDYQKLYEKLNANKKFIKNGTHFSSNEFDRIIEGKNGLIVASFFREAPNQNQVASIVFLKEKKTIVTNFCMF